MKITKPKTFDLQDQHWRRVWEDVYKLTNRNISFGTQVNGQDQNIAGAMVEIANTGAANTQFTVTHNLGRVPLFYDVKYLNVAGTIYDSGTVWTATSIYLKCSIANAKLRVFVH